MKVLVNGQEVELTDEGQVRYVDDRLRVRTAEGTMTALAIRRGDETHVSFRGQTYIVQRAGGGRARGGGVANGEMRAMMPGLVVDVLVSEGDRVEAGQKLAVLEAMKTQQPLLAPFAGIVEKIGGAKGEQVAEGQLLLIVNADG